MTPLILMLLAVPPTAPVNQGRGWDGGAWRVYVEGQAAGGGSAVQATQAAGADGGVNWGVYCANCSAFLLLGVAWSMVNAVRAFREGGES